MSDQYQTTAEAAVTLIKSTRDLLRALAELRPPITLADITPDRCNIPDREIKGEIEKLKGRYNVIDVTDLADEDGNHDVEKWERVGGGPERFDVVDVSPEDEDTEVWNVIDTENENEIVGTFDDEDDANADAEERNREDTEEGLCGFPFAHNYGVEIDRFEIDQFAEAGFLVYRYNGDKLIAGIDGGGYSFDGAHWAPLLYAKAKAGGWTIETSTGPRRVE
jgi:hypothetical protein